MSVEQMIFERPGGPDVSIFLIDGRVAAKKVGSLFPADILAFALPLAPDLAEDEGDEIADRSQKRSVAIGMKESELRVAAKKVGRSFPADSRLRAAACARPRGR